MMLNRMALPPRPESLILPRAGGSRAEGARRRGAAGQRADLLLP